MRSTVYFVIALVAAGAGFGIYRYAIEPKILSQAAPLQAAAPAAETPETGAAPQVLPDFTLTDRDGVRRSILSWPGKSMVVNFWATWCAPCRREIPLLKTLQQQHGAEGFQVVGVAVDFREDVLKYANEIGIDYPLLIGEQDAMDAVNQFGSSGALPVTVFTDNRHRIVASHLGELKESHLEVLLEAVRKVNRGELTPEAARTVVAKQLTALEAPGA
jgi:thiol-disulfide isomerase/thioredoxin